MRYFTYISIIVIGLSAVCAYLIFYNPVSVPSPAIVINERVVSAQEVDAAVTGRPPYQTKQEAIDQLISRELMIQEAMARGLDNDPQFLERVRSFYEKNLIQGLLEDQMDTISLDPIEKATIDRYADLMNKVIVLKEKRFADARALDRNVPASVREVKKPFAALSSGLRFQIAAAGEGEAVTMRQGEEWIVYVLLDATSIPDGEVEISREKLEKMIADAKRQVLLDEWVEGLRGKADIKIINTAIGGQQP
ncbi:MAG: hypothetical protein SWH61_02980 [Thermodesulfobacteriota bacterium]|nr:hypothetical protein [Thermodesulfobacteriota bacterium]